MKDLKRQADSYKTEIESQNKKMVELDRRMDSMKEMMSQQNARLAEQEDRLADMSRRLMQKTSQFADHNSKADMEFQLLRIRLFLRLYYISPINFGILIFDTLLNTLSFTIKQTLFEMFSMFPV